MAEGATVHIGENSPEQVAYKLLLSVGIQEKKDVGNGLVRGADRKWVLDTYAECLEAVQGRRSVGGGSGWSSRGAR
jgi:hypothetical protein